MNICEQPDVPSTDREAVCLTLVYSELHETGHFCVFNRLVDDVQDGLRIAREKANTPHESQALWGGIERHECVVNGFIVSRKIVGDEDGELKIKAHLGVIELGYFGKQTYTGRVGERREYDVKTDAGDRISLRPGDAVYNRATGVRVFVMK